MSPAPIGVNEDDRLSSTACWDFSSTIHTLKIEILQKVGSSYTKLQLQPAFNNRNPYLPSSCQFFPCNLYLEKEWAEVHSSKRVNEKSIWAGGTLSMTTLKVLCTTRELQRSEIQQCSTLLTNCCVGAGKLRLEEEEPGSECPCFNSGFIKCQLYARHNAEQTD